VSDNSNLVSYVIIVVIVKQQVQKHRQHNLDGCRRGAVGGHASACCEIDLCHHRWWNQNLSNYSGKAVTKHRTV